MRGMCLACDVSLAEGDRKVEGDLGEAKGVSVNVIFFGPQGLHF